jgi:single stranded DNA-binding protein
MNNNITLVGRVVQEPVKKSIPAKDTTIAEFSLAVKDYSKKGLENDAIFFDVKAFNGSVDRVMEYVSKGREIVVNGRVSVEDYKRKDGSHVIKYVVILNGFHLCGSKLDKVETASAPDDAQNNETKANETAA